MSRRQSNSNLENADNTAVVTVGVPDPETRFVMPASFEPVKDDSGAEISNLYKSKDEDKYFWRHPLTGELTELNVQSNGVFRVGKLVLQGFENERVRTIALISVILIFMINYKAKIEHDGKNLDQQADAVKQAFVASNITVADKLSANNFLNRVHDADSATQSTFTVLSIILCVSGFAGTFRRSLESVSENANALKSNGLYFALALIFGMGGLIGNAVAAVNSLISPENKMNYLELNHMVHNEGLRPLVYLFMATLSGYAFEGVCHLAGLSQKQAAEKEAGMYNNALKAGGIAWAHTKRAAHERYVGLSNAFWGGNQFEQAMRLNIPYAELTGVQQNTALASIQTAEPNATAGEESKLLNNKDNSGYTSI